MLVFIGSKKTILVLYAITFLLALYIAWPAITAGVPPSEEGKQPETAGYIFLAILAATVFLLALIKLLPWILRYLLLLLEVLLLFPAAYIVLSVFGEVPALLGALWITYTRIFFRWRWIRNVSALLIGALTAGVVGVLFSPHVLVILLLILVVYDYVSVFVTKHMLRLARQIVGEGKPSGTFALGLGDVVFPIALAVSASRIHIWVPLALLPLVLLAVYYALRTVEKTGKGVPALPPITFALLLGLTVILFLFP